MACTMAGTGGEAETEWKGGRQSNGGVRVEAEGGGGRLRAPSDSQGATPVRGGSSGGRGLEKR